MRTGTVNTTDATAVGHRKRFGHQIDGISVLNVFVVQKQRWHAERTVRRSARSILTPIGARSRVYADIVHVSAAVVMTTEVALQLLGQLDQLVDVMPVSRTAIGRRASVARRVREVHVNGYVAEKFTGNFGGQDVR